MTLAIILLGALSLVFLGVLPIWPFSREWGFGGAILVATVLLVLLAMTLTGRVPD